MKCEQVVENVPDLLVDLLEPDVRREVEEHLRGCAECGRALEKARRGLSVLNEWQPPVPPARTPTTRRALPSYAPNVWKPALGAAAALLVIGLLVVLAARPRPQVARFTEPGAPPAPSVDVPKTSELPPIKPEAPPPPKAVPLPPSPHAPPQPA